MQPNAGPTAAGQQSSGRRVTEELPPQHLADALRGESYPFSPPGWPAASAVVAPLASQAPTLTRQNGGAPANAAAGGQRQSPRVSIKPVREGYVDTSQPGLSFATPKGGIKKDSSLGASLDAQLPGGTPAFASQPAQKRPPPPSSAGGGPSLKRAAVAPPLPGANGAAGQSVQAGEAMPRKSPRVSTKPVREGYVDISQPGLSFATPKGGIKAGTSLAAQGAADAAVLASTGQPAMPPPPSSVEELMGDTARPLPASESARAPANLPAPRNKPSVEHPAREVGLQHEQVHRRQETDGRPDAETARADEIQEEMRTEDRAGNEDKTVPQEVRPPDRPRTEAVDGERSAGAPEQRARAAQHSADGKSGPAVRAAASKTASAGTKQRRQSKPPTSKRNAQKANHDGNDDDSDDDDDLPVSQLRLRHLLLQSPSRSKRKKRKARPSAASGAAAAAKRTRRPTEAVRPVEDHDPDDEVPLFLLLKVSNNPGEEDADLASNSAADRSPTAGPGDEAEAANTGSDRVPDGAPVIGDSSPRSPPAAAHVSSPSDRPARGSASRSSPRSARSSPRDVRPVNYNEDRLGAVRRPVYLDWRGEAGQDPKESGTKYAIRLGVSPNEQRVTEPKNSKSARKLELDALTQAETSFDTLSEAELVPLLAKLGCPVDGTRTELLARLRDAVRKVSESPAAKPPAGAVAARPRSAPVAAAGDASERPVYECAAILGKRTGQVGTEYLVRWAGYELSDNSWEPVEQLSNAADKIASYERRLQAATALARAAALAEASPGSSSASPSPGKALRSPSVSDSDDDLPMHQLRQKYAESVAAAKEQQAVPPCEAGGRAQAPGPEQEQEEPEQEQAEEETHEQPHDANDASRTRGKPDKWWEAGRVCPEQEGAQQPEQSERPAQQALAPSQQDSVPLTAAKQTPARRPRQKTGPPRFAAACLAEAEAHELLQAVIASQQKERLERNQNSDADTESGDADSGDRSGGGSSAREEAGDHAATREPVPSSPERGPPQATNGAQSARRPGLPPGALRGLMNRLQPPGMRSRPRSTFFNRAATQNTGAEVARPGDAKGDGVEAAAAAAAPTIADGAAELPPSSLPQATAMASAPRSEAPPERDTVSCNNNNPNACIRRPSILVCLLPVGSGPVCSLTDGACC